MNRNVTLFRASFALMLLTAIVLLFLPSPGSAQRAYPQHQAGKLLLVFPANTLTSGGGVVFTVPYSEVPVLNLSVSSQGETLMKPAELLDAGTPTFDYMPTETGFSIVAVLASPSPVDRVFTVDWRASLPTQ